MFARFLKIALLATAWLMPVQAAELFHPPRVTAFSTSGTALSGAKLYFYQTGTTTPQNTYSNSGLSVANANPVVADSAGLFGAIYLDDSLPAYKVVLKTSSDVTIWTVDPYDVQFSQAAIGAILYPQSTAESNASVTPSSYAYPWGDLRRYGGVGDDSTSNNTAFSNAFAQFKQGGAPIFIPAGTYRVSTQLLYELPDPLAAQTQGLIMRGEGMYRSIIKSSASSTSALRLSIADTDAAMFQNGVVLSDFALIPNGSPTTLHGLQLTGVYQARIERVRIQDFTGHGIYQPDLDATFTGGPDYYGAVFLQIWNCKIDNNVKHGIWSEMGAAFVTSLRDTVIQNNDEGGVYLEGAGAGEIVGGSISYNSTASNGYGGLSLARSAGSFASGAQTLYVSRVEFDRNQNYNVNVGALTNGIFEQNRFIGADDGVTNMAHVPPTHVKFSLVASGTAADIIFRNNFLRRTDSTYAVTGFDLGNDANVSHVYLVGNRWASTSNTTKYTNAHASSRIQIEDSGQIIRTNLAGSFARGRITTGSPVVTGSAADIVWTGETTDTNSSLDTTTGIYTAAATGVYSVSVGLTIESLSDGNLITLKLIQDASGDFTAHETVTEAQGISAETVQLNTKIFLNAGDTLRVQASQNNGSDKAIKVGEPYNWFVVALDAQ